MMKLSGLLGMTGLLVAGCMSSSTSIPTNTAEERNSKNVYAETEPIVLSTTTEEAWIDTIPPVQSSMVFSANTVDDWIGNDLTEDAAEDAVLVPGCQILITKNNTQIDPTKAYRLTGEFLWQEQSTSDKPLQAFLGFVMYTKDGKRIFAENIRPRPETDTVLTRRCGKDDTSVYVANGEKWNNDTTSVIAFNTLSDFQDLPNFQTTSAQQITGIEKINDGEYRIDLKAPCGFEAAKGSGVRQHQAWGYMYTAGSGKLIPGEWIELSGVVQGSAKSGMPINHFGPGIERVGFVLLSNWNEASDENVMLFRNIQLEEVSDEALTPEERAVLAN